MASCNEEELDPKITVAPIHEVTSVDLIEECAPVSNKRLSNLTRSQRRQNLIC